MNDIIQSIASTSPSAAFDWLQNNIFAYVLPDNVPYIALGNEVFLHDLSFLPYLVRAILNLYQALQTLGLLSTIKLSSPQAASVLSNSYPLSFGSFDPKLRSTMLPQLQFLHETRSAFMINVYPYITNTNDINHLSLDHALFRAKAKEIIRDGTLVYDNLFDASMDALVYAMEREGYGNVLVVVAETGWPTSGGEAASRENPLTYDENVGETALSGIGTQARQGVEACLICLMRLGRVESKAFWDRWCQDL